jgi:hypothetical protein
VNPDHEEERSFEEKMRWCAETLEASAEVLLGIDRAATAARLKKAAQLCLEIA